MGTISTSLFCRHKQTYVNDTTKVIASDDWSGNDYILDTLELSNNYSSLYDGGISASGYLYFMITSGSNAFLSFDGVNNSFTAIEGQPQIIKLDGSFSPNNILAIAPSGISTLEYLFIEKD